MSMFFMSGVCLIITGFSVAPVPEPNDLCYVCDDDASNTACNRQLATICPGDTNACQTIVMFEDGFLNITKGCTNIVQCNDSRDASITQCTHESLTYAPVRCQLCCQGDLCNADNTDGILQSCNLTFTLLVQEENMAVRGDLDLAISIRNLIATALLGHNASYDVQINSEHSYSVPDIGGIRWENRLEETNISGTITAHTLVGFDMETIERTVYSALISSFELQNRGVISESIDIKEAGYSNYKPPHFDCKTVTARVGDRHVQLICTLNYNPRIHTGAWWVFSDGKGMIPVTEKFTLDGYKESIKSDKRNPHQTRFVLEILQVNEEHFYKFYELKVKYSGGRVSKMLELQRRQEIPICYIIGGCRASFIIIIIVTAVIVFVMSRRIRRLCVAI